MPDFTDPMPSAPPRRPERFQFTVAALIGLTALCAFGAAALRLSGLPQDAQLVGFLISGVFLVYLLWRWSAAWRRYGRWQEVQRHRAELEDWVKQRKEQIKRASASEDSPPAE